MRVAALTADVLRGLGSTFMAVLISAGTLPNLLLMACWPSQLQTSVKLHTALC